ncbi:MAG: ABC transporter substrate-binding protein [Nitriliruptorales bacterium]|nr:ABC transporter substrate-binding protein [Nitriliruptorales bacterium]
MALSPLPPVRLCAGFLFAILLTGCGGGATIADDPSAAASSAPPDPAAADANLRDNCIDDFAADTDYFPEKVTFDHATGVTVDYENSYKIVDVTTLEGEEPQTYVLLQCGADEPELDGELAGAQVIQVPVTSSISLTTTNLPHFAELGAADTVVGVGTAAYVATPEILELAESGEVAEFANAEGQPDQEAIIGAQPDLLVMDAFGEAILEEANRFVQAGVPTVLNADFNEQELLGRAEWLKFTSLFLNAEADANTTFDGIAAEYERVADLATHAEQRPTVFANTPLEGTWFTPGGDSFFANAVADANAEYAFSDDEATYSLELDIETVLDKAGEADVWLQAGSVQGSLKDLAKTDERFKEFKAFKEGEVWAYDKAMSPGGGNAFFETGYTRADVVLSDLVKIFHPDVLPEHELVYFGKVPRSGKG